MNKNTRSWAVKVGNPELSEAVQLIAFSFGYGWTEIEAGVSHTNEKFLIFNPDHKTIQYAEDLSVAEMYACQTILDFGDVVKLFKNPPASKLEVGVGIFVDKEGNVTTNQTTIGSYLFDELVTKRNDFLGRKPEKRILPSVEFTYYSQSSGRKLRRILVLADNEDAIFGLDKDDGFQQKKYLHGNIIGQIAFMGFDEEP